MPIIPAHQMLHALILLALSSASVKRALSVMDLNVPISTSVKLASTIVLRWADTVSTDPVDTLVNVRKASSAMDGSVPMWTNARPKSHPVTNEPSALTNRVLIVARIVSSRYLA